MRFFRSIALVVGFATTVLPVAAPIPAQAYVAIWYDEVTGIFGKTHRSENSRPTADFAAAGDCWAKGGDKNGCKPTVYSKEGCVALAINGKRWGSGSSASMERAEQKALARAGGGIVMVRTCDSWEQ